MCVFRLVLLSHFFSSSPCCTVLTATLGGAVSTLGHYWVGIGTVVSTLGACTGVGGCTVCTWDCKALWCCTVGTFVGSVGGGIFMFFKNDSGPGFGVDHLLKIYRRALITWSYSSHIDGGAYSIAYVRVCKPYSNQS